jgi:hypothetical protein
VLHLLAASTKPLNSENSYWRRANVLILAKMAVNGQIHTTNGRVVAEFSILCWHHAMLVKISNYSGAL